MAVDELYDVYIVYKDDTEQGKERPAVIVAIEDGGVTNLMMAVYGMDKPKYAAKKYLAGNKEKIYVIQDYLEAGLTKPSLILLENVYEFDFMDLLAAGTYRGKLTRNDSIGLRKQIAVYNK